MEFLELSKGDLDYVINGQLTDEDDLQLSLAGRTVELKYRQKNVASPATHTKSVTITDEDNGEYQIVPVADDFFVLNAGIFEANIKMVETASDKPLTFPTFYIKVSDNL